MCDTIRAWLACLEVVVAALSGGANAVEAEDLEVLRIRERHLDHIGRVHGT